MSELKPCPFCGAEAHGYEIEAHQHSPALLALCPGLPPEPKGRYVIEGRCACGSGLIGDSQEEVTERWNRRAQPAQAGQVLTRHEQEDLYRETSNRVAQLEAENRYEFASWFFIAVELVEQAVRAKLGAGVPMTDPQLQTSEERRATGDRILELIEKQHPGIVGEKGGA